MKRVLKIRFTEDYFLSTNNQHYSMISKEQFVEHFLPSTFQYELVSKEESADICVVGLYTTEGIRDSEFNLLISIENYAKWSWYKHRNHYGETGDKQISAYYYAHHSDFVENSDYLIIPTIHAYLHYFLSHQLSQPLILRETVPEKSCLMINSSRLNPNIAEIAKLIQGLGLSVESINAHPIQGKSCYYSPELLGVFRQYKFIICIENSYQNGYITEKIFNCFFSQTVPLYLGAFDVSRFICPESFVDLRKDGWQKQIQDLNSDSKAYLKMINANKIQQEFVGSSHLYLDKLSERIQEFLNPVKKIIAFSLWGTSPFYNYGAYENAILALTIFPGWICRFYHFEADPQIISLLSKLDNVELVEMTKSEQNANMFWRFESAFTEENVILLSRDTDSRLNYREKWAVDQWLLSTKNFHIIRDHSLHGAPILGGTWGVRNNKLLPLKDQFVNFVRHPQKGHDQTFLAKVVYPLVYSDTLIHDNYHLYPHEKVDTIPNIPEYSSFIGAYCLDVRATSEKLNLNCSILEKPEHLLTAPENHFWTPPL